ncbi:methylmalonyl-CoA mutase, partial [bacterium]|nr:methylmalonyl-CoA mutase [bacterium]
LGGSYYIEETTDRIEREAFDYIEKIDAMGGMASAIEKGFVQKEIQKSAYEYQKAIEANKRIIVGVNKFQTDEPPLEDLLKVDEAIGIKQREKLAKVKSQRDNAEVRKRLSAIESSAKGDDNLVPPILEAVRTYATIGEISDVLRGIFGEYREQIII